jgi:hypothetical protein
MDTLNEHLKRCATKHKLKRKIATRMDLVTLKLKDYYSKIDKSPLYFAAVVFHPNFRRKYVTSTGKRDVARGVLAKVKLLRTEYRDSISVPEPVDYEIPSLGPPTDRNIYSDIRQEPIGLIGRAIRPRSQDEYRDCCNETPYEVDKALIAWSSERWW